MTCFRVRSVVVGEPILHVYADYKWTGPSGPVARLCRELSRQGWRSDLVCARPPPESERSLGSRAREMGLGAFEEGFCLDSSCGLRGAMRDVKALRELIREGGYRLVHCHGSWDHFICALALRRRRGATSLVRTDHRGRAYRRNPFWRRFYGPRTLDHLIVLSDRYAAQAVDRMKLAPDSVSSVRGAVDTEEYRPVQPPPELRKRLGLGAQDVVFGVVARVQWHRRFDVLLEAALRVQRQSRRIKIAVCGRGTHKREILDEPLARLGLEGTVLPLGYRTDDYMDVLSTFDAGLMLAPGSDGSCRAALQMAAMGKPLLVARRGTLPDIVVDGETGVVIDDSPANLAEAMLQVAADRDARRRWGVAGRRRMQEHFSLSVQAERVRQVYEKVLGRRPEPAHAL